MISTRFSRKFTLSPKKLTVRITFFLATLPQCAQNVTFWKKLNNFLLYASILITFFWGDVDLSGL